jgi:hypothetical protein
MRTHLDVIDDEGVTNKLAMFGSKSNSGVHVVVRTEQPADPIALDKTYQPLGHVIATDQAALWQELMGRSLHRLRCSDSRWLFGRLKKQQMMCRAAVPTGLSDPFSIGRLSAAIERSASLEAL